MPVFSDLGKAMYSLYSVEDIVGMTRMLMWKGYYHICFIPRLWKSVNDQVQFFISGKFCADLVYMFYADTNNDAFIMRVIVLSSNKARKEELIKAYFRRKGLANANDPAVIKNPLISLKDAARFFVELITINEKKLQLQ